MMRRYEPMLDETEKLSVSDLQTLQLKRLKNSLNHAYNNSTAYRKAFDNHGVKPLTFTHSLI